VDTLDRLLEPFWLSRTMYRESVMFVAAADATAHATLLFRPDKVLAVNDASETISYDEEADYRIDSETRRIIRPPWSRMTCVSPETMRAADGTVRHNWMVAVSYTHDRDHWQRFVPGNAAAQLPHVSRKLERCDPLTICLTGDSISEGYDASGFHHLRPGQPPFGSLVAAALGERSGANIQFHNFATAGWTTEDGLWDTARIMPALTNTGQTCPVFLRASEPTSHMQSSSWSHRCFPHRNAIGLSTHGLVSIATRLLP
jgi:acyl-CoA thioesterase I